MGESDGLSPFLDYLCEKKCISAIQKEVIMRSENAVVLDETVLHSLFSLVDVAHVPEEYLKQAQIIIQFKMMAPELIEAELFAFDIDHSHTHVTLTELQTIDDTFLNEYLPYFVASAQKVFGNYFTYEKIGTCSQLYCDALCFQKINGPPHVLIGISAKLNLLTVSAVKIYEHYIPPERGESFSGKKEDIIDSVCEFLNNTNQVCTYKFNLEFDLTVPECSENITIKGNPIYKINFQDAFDLIIIPNCPSFFRGISCG